MEERLVDRTLRPLHLFQYICLFSASSTDSNTEDTWCFDIISEEEGVGGDHGGKECVFAWSRYGVAMFVVAELETSLFTESGHELAE